MKLFRRIRTRGRKEMFVEFGEETFHTVKITCMFAFELRISINPHSQCHNSMSRFTVPQFLFNTRSTVVMIVTFRSRMTLSRYSVSYVDDIVRWECTNPSTLVWCYTVGPMTNSFNGFHQIVPVVDCLHRVRLTHSFITRRYTPNCNRQSFVVTLRQADIWPPCNRSTLAISWSFSVEGRTRNCLCPLF